MITPILFIWGALLLIGVLCGLLMYVVNSDHMTTGTDATFHDVKATSIDSSSFTGPDEYKGTWSAATNTPTLANGTGDAGDYYIVSAGGSVNFGAGAITFTVNDRVIYNGAIWQKIDSAVTAVEVPIADAGTIITATEVEGALQESRLLINANTTKTAVITRETAGAGAKIVLPESTGSGVNTVTFGAPAALTGDRTITIPDADVNLADATAAKAAVDAAVTATNAGAGNAGKLIELDGAGKLDGSTIAELAAAKTEVDNAVTSTAGGAGNAGKLIELDGAGKLDGYTVAELLSAKTAVDAAVAVTNGGAGNAGKLFELDGTGKAAGRVIETDGAKLDTMHQVLDGLSTVPVVEDLREAGWAVDDTGIIQGTGGVYYHVIAGTSGASAGYATLTSPLGAISGATALANDNTYDVTLTVDGVALGLITTNTMAGNNITGALAALQTNLQTATGKTETVSILYGRIEVRSSTTGVSSNVIIAPGTGNDLIAALNTALGTTLVVNTPKNGTATTPTPVQDYGGLSVTAAVTATNGGAGNSGKLLKLDTGGKVDGYTMAEMGAAKSQVDGAVTDTGAGAGNAGKLIELDAGGLLDGRDVGADGSVIDALESYTDGQFSPDFCNGIARSGTWAPMYTSDLIPELARTPANATTQMFIVELPLKAKTTPTKGVKITGVKVAYSCNGEDNTDDFQVRLLKRVLPADNAAPVAAVIIAGDADGDYDVAHNTAALRVDDAGAPENHTLTMSVPIGDQAYIADKESWQLCFYVNEANDAGHALTIIVKDVQVLYTESDA